MPRRYVAPNWFTRNGYPDGLAREEIPLIARIVCCCDAFNAMTTHRPYRDALNPHEAITELRANTGTQFDPIVVDALLTLVPSDLESVPQEGWLGAIPA
jgi:HD-GYP domain-containing protein (c-di-GMP phosphodiesterase class II)